jgi:hypothetical protein
METIAMLALVAATAAIILPPLLKRVPWMGPSSLAPVSPGTGAAETLADLEFDHATGKLDDADYAALRADVEHARLEESARPAPAGEAARPEETLESVEAEILAARRKGRFCVACGTPLPKAARFCPDCGTPVRVRP